MANQGRELYEFGPFRLDPEKRVLLRDSQPVPLQLKAFETLLVLVRHSQQVVLKDELMKAVWPDTFVEEANLSQNIFVLRKVLGTSSGNQKYIDTIPGRGYRFAENVRLVPVEDALVLQRHSRARILIEENLQQATIAVPVPSPHTAVSPWSSPARLAIVLGSLLLALGLVSFLFRPTIPPPRVTRIHQLTHIGTLVHNTHLLTDGPRIYFRVWQDKKRELRSVSTEGGEALPIQIPIPETDLDDISPDGSEFLAVNLIDRQLVADSPDPYFSLWRVPVPTGSPRPVAVRTREAHWSPDGRTIAYSLPLGLFQANLDGSHSTQLARVPGEPFYLRWSPDGQHIRFTAPDPTRTRHDLWQVDVSTHAASPLIPDLPSSSRPWAAGWTPDGKYFFYSAVNEGTRNIYAIREKNELFRRSNPQPVQLTSGPLTFYLPLPSKDGKRLFAVGEQLRGALIRYDSSTRQFVPYAQSISADHIAFSPDGQWMAYVEFPDGTLVRSRIDGSDLRRLTFSPMRAFSPQWSPDGTQIAFQASSDVHAYNKIYLVSVDGGVPALATPPSDDRQTYPSWTSDGASILFSSSDPSESKSDLRMLDLKNKHVSPLPRTEDLGDGQISPDGRNTIAINGSTHALTLYNIETHATRTLAELGDYPRWSRDGKFVYYNSYYFNITGRNGGVYRWNASTGAIEELAEFPKFLLAGTWGVTFSLAPDGSILMLKDVSNRDLYCLDLDLP